MLLTDNDTGFWCSGASEKRSGPLTNPKTGRIRRFAVRIANNALPARGGIRGFRHLKTRPDKCIKTS